MTLKELRSITDKTSGKVSITRGCDNIGGCYCTGRCKEVVGYYENGVYTPVEEEKSLFSKDAIHKANMIAMRLPGWMDKEY